MRKADVLNVLRRHQLLSLAIAKQISPREAAQEPEISLSHAKKLLKGLKQTGRNPDWLLLPPALQTRAERAASGIQKARW
jgi:hypothetical protein